MTLFRTATGTGTLDAPLAIALAKVFARYDNDWGYANRPIGLIGYIASKL